MSVEAQGDTNAETTGTLLEQATTETTEQTPTVGTTEGVDTLLGSGGEEGQEEPTKQEAPENYEDFTFPEGVDVDENLLGEFTPIAKELGLSQDGAQKMVGMYANHIATQVQAFEQDMAAKTAANVKQITSVPNYQAELLSPAKHALSTLAGKEDAAYIQQSFGNDPVVIRFLATVGKKLREDVSIDTPTQTEPKGEETDNLGKVATALYNNMR